MFDQIHCLCKHVVSTSSSDKAAEDTRGFSSNVSCE